MSLESCGEEMSKLALCLLTMVRRLQAGAGYVFPPTIPT